VDDLRESPAIQAAHLLKAAGADVTAFEPYKPCAAVEGIRTAGTLEQILQGVEVLVLLVGHTVFKDLQPGQLAGMTPARVLVDCVDLWTDPAWKAAGFDVHRLGVGWR
jgi:UDP-N-acetyl-D-mannosaminuronate dehydrogenase